MDFIKSQDISEKLTHILHKKEDYDIIQKTGIKITFHKHSMLWKPEAFWISMEYDWERWCHGEDFVNIPEATICDVSLKKDLVLLKITNVEQAEELAKKLMPNYVIPRRFSFKEKFCDMLTFTMYIIDKLKEGIIVGPEIWNPITENYDGIYFVNSGSLHFDTFFNTWDAHCIALFDGKNATLSNPRSGKEIMDEIEVHE